MIIRLGTPTACAFMLPWIVEKISEEKIVYCE
jgi:hypothetical protein